MCVISRSLLVGGCLNGLAASELDYQQLGDTGLCSSLLCLALPPAPPTDDDDDDVTIVFLYIPSVACCMFTLMPFTYVYV